MAPWAWGCAAGVMALLPFVAGLTGSRIFYIRDLSLYFWNRYLWLRRAWYAGEFPLWDPYIGGGQSAVADALHQMFLLPAATARMLGGEVFGFNLWVALPYPLAAVGAYAFLTRHFSQSGAALGAIVFAMSGTVVSTANFPNLSWSIAGLPWVLWAMDRLIFQPSRRALAVAAISVAMQVFSGEPVTVFTTIVVITLYAEGAGNATALGPVKAMLRVCGAAVIGLGLSGVQLLPMVGAAIASERAATISPDLWSLRPPALLETVWFQLFGDYFETQSFADVPWMPLMFTGREPFFFSIYFGTPTLALAAYGLAGDGPRWWRLVWVITALVGIIAAFGAYTPIYPIFRDHVPLFGSFRFPVKYLLVLSMAVAAGVAAGWDALSRPNPLPDSERRLRRARLASLGFAGSVAAGAFVIAAGIWFAPDGMASLLARIAEAFDAADGQPAAEFMLKTAPRGAVVVLALALAGGLLLRLAQARPQGAPSRIALTVLFLLITVDLTVRAWPINPVLDPGYLAQPDWVGLTAEDSEAYVYVGGKRDGTLDPMDFDGSRAFLNPPGLTGSASRAAVSTQAVYYPSAWRLRELLSYDLAVLWPRRFTRATERFFNARPEERERFLDRTGARYRILPLRRAPGREPLMPISYFYESFFFDWGEGSVAPRLSVVPAVTVEADVEAQIAALFTDGWDYRQMAYVDRDIRPSGQPGAAAVAAARVLGEASNWLTVEASAGADGGYLVVLDSYSDDWRVTVDGMPAEMARANGLFRAVRLAPGTHRVEFTYRPRALWVGACISALALLACAGLFVANPGRRRVGAPEVAVAQ